jgi:hypothetical protein
MITFPVWRWQRYERIRCARLHRDFTRVSWCAPGTVQQALLKSVFCLIPAKRYKWSNRQDLVFVRPPDAGKDFRVSNNTVWYCRVLLLFSFYTSTDTGIKRHNCSSPCCGNMIKIHLALNHAESVLKIYLIIVILDVLHRVSPGAWAAVPVSFISAGLIYQVFYVLPVESILETLPVVPVGETGMIPYCMLQHAEDLVGAAFDTREGAGDSSRWGCINTWALSWSRERCEK